jgi:hypothetical protein
MGLNSPKPGGDFAGTQGKPGKANVSQPRVGATTGPTVGGMVKQGVHSGGTGANDKAKAK